MIDFDVLTPLPKALPKPLVIKVGRIVSASFPKRNGSLSLSFFSEAKMQTLNKRTRGHNKATDVLSFPASLDRDFSNHKDKSTLGDIIICVPYAAREAKRRSIPLTEELARLLIHGALHIRGYDHDTPEKEAKMFALQERYVEMATSSL